MRPRSGPHAGDRRTAPVADLTQRPAGRRLRIGSVTFRVVKACSRCVVTTTDQETGERGGEPLRILARHRKVGKKVLFGVNLIPDPPYGEIAASDPVALVG